MGELGIKGLDPTKVSLAMDLVQQLGADTEVDMEDIQAYYPRFESEEDLRDFYIPRVPKGFYDAPKRLRELGTPDFAYLRKLVTPNFKTRW